MPAGVDPADHRDRVVDLRRVEPGQRLVEQQHLGALRERAGHLQQLPFVQVERGRVGVGEVVEPDDVQVLLGDAAGRAPAAPARART